MNTPERIRTSDPRIRSPILYPAELRALVKPYQYVTLKKGLTRRVGVVWLRTGVFPGPEA